MCFNDDHRLYVNRKELETTVHKALAVFLVVMATTVAVLPAYAAKKEKPRSRSGASPSLDGRVLGYPRTCGHDYFQYSTTGTPVGPYCH